MRFQFAGRLRANDYVYLFISQRYPRLLDRLFASPAPVAEDDAEFFGAFAIDPTRPAGELQAAYGPELQPGEQDKTIGELMKDRLGGRAEYADRVAFGPVELIVRDVDEEGAIVSVGISLAPEEQKAQLPLFLNLREIRDFLRHTFGGKSSRKGKAAGAPDANAEVPDELSAHTNDSV
jgi:cell volume regulation protein A